MLSCSCNYDWDYDYGDWCYIYDKSKIDFEKLNTSKRKRCCSCNELINIGALCLEHCRSRYPYSEIEARIVGADPDLNEEPPIWMASHYQCEHCAEIWLNLTDIGYECLYPNENMNAAMDEYLDIVRAAKGVDTRDNTTELSVVGSER